MSLEAWDVLCNNQWDGGPLNAESVTNVARCSDGRTRGSLGVDHKTTRGEGSNGQ
jgi:hypothetical protein